MILYFCNQTGEVQNTPWKENLQIISLPYNHYLKVALFPCDQSDYKYYYNVRKKLDLNILRGQEVFYFNFGGFLKKVEDHKINFNPRLSFI